jgi:hypothetical protein
LSTDRFPISASLYTNTVGGNQVVNTTTETSLFTGATGSPGSTLTIEAGSVTPGAVYRIYLDLAYTTTGTPTLRIKIKLGGTAIGDSTAFNAPTGTANGRAFIDGYIFIDSVGATGSTRVEMLGNMMPASGGTATPLFFVGSLGTITIDFTVNQIIDVTAQWGTASASNVMVLIHSSIQRIR